MKNSMSFSWTNSVPGNNMIELSYREWLSHYTQSVAISESAKTKKIWNDRHMAAAHQIEAIKYLKQCIAYEGTPEQHLMKIPALLLLFKLHKEHQEKEEGENCFYHAAEILDAYEWNTSLASYEKEIVDVYLSDMHPDIKKAWKWESIDPLVPILIQTSILPESRRRIRIEKLEEQLEKNQSEEKHLKELDRFRNYLVNAQTKGEIIKELENMYGSTFRLCIVCKEGDEVLTNHGFRPNEVEILRKTPTDMQDRTLDIFDKPRKYAVKIDRGADLSVPWFDEYQLKNIINPAINRFIELSERLYLRDASGNINLIEAIEKNMNFPLKRNDYSVFVTEVIWKYTDTSGFCNLEKYKKDHYADTFLKALDICRNITLQSKNFSQKIDLILWGKMEREVLDKAKSMLLSRNETMNGLGFPFGLTKKTIPLEGRIYPIIRAYEALSTEKTPELVRKTMQDWAQGGYFDSDIIRIFFESLDKNKTFPTLPPYSTNLLFSSEEDRKNRKNRENRYYIPFIESVTRLLAVANDIGDKYYKWRMEKDNVDVQNVAFKKANELQSELLEIADIPILLYLSRHGRTMSDVPGWPPGSKNEPLTPEGVIDSEKKWIEFEGLDFRLLTSPLHRAVQTANIIRKNVKNCVQSILNGPENTSVPNFCVSCADPDIEEALINPPKNKQNERYNSMLEKILVDDNTKWLLEFTKKLISSPKGSVNLLITHRDTARHLYILLKNLSSKEEISGHKIAIENDGIYEFTVRWGRLLSDKERKTRGLLFSVKNWKLTLLKINALSKETFGEIFYDPKNQWVDLIVLHNRFLDFIDQKREQNPDKLWSFIAWLQANKTTKHLLPIIKTSNML